MTEEEVKTENGNGAENSEKTNEVPNEMEIIKQVEYYFGDINLTRDKFLKEQIALDQGWVPLDVLITFRRLARHTTDTKLIAEILQKSTSGLIEVSDDNKKVRRNPEMPIPEMNEERRKEIMARTVYVKGFPKDVEMDALLAYFKEHGDFENLIMRKYQDKIAKKKLFKGSVFVTFKNKEDADKFLAAAEPKYKDEKLMVSSQEEYLKVKQEEYANRKEKKDKKKDTEEKKPEEEKNNIVLPTGTVLKFVIGDKTVSRESIKEALLPLGGEIAYITFNTGDSDGWVRYTTENIAKEILDKMEDGKITIKDNSVTFSLLEEDEEKTFLENTKQEMLKRRKTFKNNKNFRGQKGNHKFRGQKRKQNDDGGGVAAKIKATGD